MLLVDQVMSRHDPDTTDIGAPRLQPWRHLPAFGGRDLNLLASLGVNKEVTRRQDFDGLDRLHVRVVVVYVDLPRDLLLDDLYRVFSSQFLRDRGEEGGGHFGLFAVSGFEAGGEDDVVGHRRGLSAGGLGGGGALGAVGVGAHWRRDVI